MTRLNIASSDIGLAANFDWESPNHKSHAMTSSEIFKRGTFCRAKILYNGRLEALAWFGT